MEPFTKTVTQDELDGLRWRLEDQKRLLGEIRDRVTLIIQSIDDLLES